MAWHLMYGAPGKGIRIRTSEVNRRYAALQAETPQGEENAYERFARVLHKQVCLPGGRSWKQL